MRRGGLILKRYAAAFRGTGGPPVCRAVLAALLAFAPVAMAAPVPAFPGAEGFGANASGGRGGDVYHVTSLADDGSPGTFRHGLETVPKKGGRTIVFDVSGTIRLTAKLDVGKPNVTIAGQTAPGQGITLRDHPFNIKADNVICRHIRSRLGTAAGAVDAFDIQRGGDIIVDHCSASWSVDETFSITDKVRNITVQYCFVTESLNDSIHPKHEHGYGSLLRPRTDAQLSFHHNLYAHHNSRNPRAGSYYGTTLDLDWRNNVIYDWGKQPGYSMDQKGEEHVNLNFVANYLVAGPSTIAEKLTTAFDGGGASTKIYQSGNLIDSNRNGVLDGTDTGWAMITGTYTKADAPFPMAPVKTDPADVAYRKVMASGGALPWARDAVDARIVREVAGESGKIVDTVEQAGGWQAAEPVVERRPAGYDTDGDGIPDAWEAAHGSNPRVADNNVMSANGYTNLENYLNSIGESVPKAGGADGGPPR